VLLLLLLKGLAVGSKRSRPDSTFTPVHKRTPQLSADCLASLCAAIADDGLLQLPASYDVNQPNYHVELAREAGFRGFVLRSCANLLESVQATAVSQALLGLKGEAIWQPKHVAHVPVFTDV